MKALLRFTLIHLNGLKILPLGPVLQILVNYHVSLQMLVLKY